MRIRESEKRRPGASPGGGAGRRDANGDRSAVYKERKAERRRPGRQAYGDNEADAAAAREQDAARRQRRRALLRERRARTVRRQKIAALAAVLLVIFLGFAGTQVFHRAYADSNLSDSVLGYRDLVEKYAKQSGIGDYVDTLLAIMMVESEGMGEDVMQSSESKGLEPGSLHPEESIEQACVYFAALVEIEQGLGIDDDKALIQAYNFGPGYLYYLADHGKKHRQNLAIEYAKEQSGGEKIRYLHLYAIKKNGGWIYKFGNMFYDALVQQYL